MAKNSAWLVDANNIQIDDYSKADLENSIIKTNEIEFFLSSSEANKYFIVGPKGLGKTLLLKLKSLQLREKGYKVLPENLLCEKLDGINEQFTYNEIRDLETERMWEIIWEMGLCCWIMIGCEIAIPDELSKLFGKATSLSHIVKNLLAAGTKNIDKLYKKYNNSELRPTVDNLQRYGVSQLAIFIDNVDEALSDHVGEKNRVNTDRSYLVSHKIWIRAQISLLSLSKRLINSNPHLKIYLSIRSEAYNQIIAAEKTQIRDLSISLKYSKEQIREIFIKNIKHTKADDLAFPREVDHIKSFVGLSKIPHKFAKDGLGNAKHEDVFDFIYRHTFGRPREIILMGNKIYAIDKKNRTESSIHSAVNEVSINLFEQFTLEIVPYFDLKRFKRFCTEVRKNIFNISTAERVQQLFKSDESIPNICSNYWNSGLLGIVKHNGFTNDTLVQSFQPVGQYTLSENTVPESEYFVLHPATYSIMEEVLYDRSSFYDLDNIVGYEYRFHKPRIANNKIKYHLHIGLERDGISILIPTIYEYKSVAIIINPFDNIWSQIRKVEYFDLNVNGESFRFRVYRDDFPTHKKQKIFREWIDEKQSTLFYTDNQPLLDDIVNVCSTISLTEYDNTDFFSGISENLNNLSKIVYLCKKTFDKDLNKIFSEYLAGKFSNWECQLVLIDRYTLLIEREIHDSILMCRSTVEEYPGKQVSIFHNQASILPSNVVHRPKTIMEFNFLVREFELLREGIYQYYKYLRQKNLIVKTYKESETTLRLFGQLQVEALIGTTDKNVLKAVYGKDVKPELRKELIEQCILHLERLDNLSKYTFNLAGQSVDVDKLKQQDILVDDATFYQFIKYSQIYYSDPGLIVNLMKDLHIVPITAKYDTVFISYSFRDSIFATLIADYLIINGVEVDMFELDNPQGKLKGVMSEYVKKNDKMIFISSENSLKSEACHFELKNCRDKTHKLWGNRLIPIMLDRFILEIEEYRIPPIQRRIFWENIEFIKEDVIQDFTAFNGHIDNHHLEKQIRMKIIENCLIKRG